MNTKLTPNFPLDASPTVTPSPKRSRPPAPRTVDFNLPEAVRLAALGYGYRKIARALGNCSHETVRTKLREYEARIEASKPKPKPEPVKPPVPSVDSARTAYVPDVRPPVPPEQPVTTPSPPPEPITNLDGLANYWAVRGRPNFKPDTRAFFLVNGAANTLYGAGSEQFMVGIDAWHAEYWDLELFHNVERVWIVLDPRQDNRKFLVSIINDIRIRERCAVVRDTFSSNPILEICRSRYAWTTKPWHSHVSEDWRDDDRAQFEESYRFHTLPQPNHVEMIEELLKSPVIDVPQSLPPLLPDAPWMRRGDDDDDLPPPRGDRV